MTPYLPLAPGANPLYDGWRNLSRLFTDAQRAILSEAIPNIHRYGQAWAVRYELIHNYAYGVPSPEMLNVIGSYGPIVEIGAGRGYWAKLLADMGVDIVATDLQHPMELDDEQHRALAEAGPTYPYFKTPGLYHPVEQIDALAAARHYADRTLLVVWPSLNERWAAKAIQAYRDAGGRCVLYVGEPANGCCADDAFFDALSNWFVCSASYPACPWWGVHDVFEAWTRERVSQ